VQSVTNIAGDRAKLFLSCGQDPAYNEPELGNEIEAALGRQGLGFDIFFAPRVQRSKALTEVIFRELQTSDYFVFVDFKREELLPPNKVNAAQHRGSLFSHQEFALACYLDLDVACFRETGVEPLKGVVGAVMGNATEFTDRNMLVDLIRTDVQQKVANNEWSLVTRNRLQLAKARDEGVPATWIGEVNVSYFHINVRNLHWRKPATNCYAYLDEVVDLKTGKKIEHYTCELKWEGTMLSGVRIQPQGYRGLDAFIIVPNEGSNELWFKPQTDAVNHVLRLKGSQHLEVTYVVTCDQFRDARQKFEVLFDGSTSVEFSASES
jgi:hypothetical protein